jgi:hypothetical protein
MSNDCSANGDTALTRTIGYAPFPERYSSTLPAVGVERAVPRLQ